MTNLDIAQELIMKFHKEKPEQMHLLQFSMWIDTQRNETQEPTLEKLLEDTYYNFSLYNMGTYWVAQTDEKTSNGPTPSLALLALREKLSTNQ